LLTCLLLMINDFLVAMMEWVLRRFVAVCEGDKIQVEHDGKHFRFNVLKVRSAPLPLPCSPWVDILMTRCSALLSERLRSPTPT